MRSAINPNYRFEKVIESAMDSHLTSMTEQERVAAALEPYLDAALSETPSGNAEFDQEVLGVKDPARFLAARALEALSQTMPHEARERQRGAED